MYFSRVVDQHGIKPPLWIAHDEFKEYFYKWGQNKFVLTTRKEREEKRK